MVWRRRYQDYTDEDRSVMRRAICKVVDPYTAQQIDPLLRHAASRSLTKDDLKWLTGIPVIRKYPYFIQGLNRFIASHSELWISCSNDAPAYYIAILDRDRATIYDFSGAHPSPPIMFSSEVAEYVQDETRNKWAEVLHACQNNPAWGSCLLELLQREREKNHGSYRRKVSSLQLLVSKKISRIPPSMYLYDIRITKDLTKTRAVDLGGSGHIYQGTAGDHILCLKVIRVDDIYKRETVMKSILREVVPWSRLNHKNIVPFCGVIELPDFPGQIALISPWMENGSIKTFIHKHPQCNRFKFVKEIIAGLKALHSENPPIFHRDLKSANILVMPDGTCCIADFGVSSISESQRVESKSGHGSGGTLRWRPPEALMSQSVPSQDSNTSKAPPLNTTLASGADLWALGCVIYEIYTGHHPYANYANDGQAMRANAIRHELPGEMPSTCPAVIHKFVFDCWQSDPKHRPDLRDPENARYYPDLFDY